MRTIRDGHIYELEGRPGEGDGACGLVPRQRIEFVNREPGHERDGTTTQEVIRSLIDRTQYCDHCLPWSGNVLIVQHLRMALALHEVRAILRKVETGELKPELIPIDMTDHHWAGLQELIPSPAYAFPERPAATETASLQPGQPCHTPKVA